MLNQVFYDLELEQCQVRMLQSVKHSEEIRIREFICFLGSFHNYLTIPRNIFGELKTPGFAAAKHWVKVLCRYAKIVGIPEDMVGHLQTALGKSDKFLLAWVLVQTKESLYSIVNKK